MAKYPDPEHIRSHERLVRTYLQCRDELNSLRKANHTANIVTKDARKELRAVRAEAKSARASSKSLRVALTRKELAGKHAANASKFAAIGGVCTEILYQTWEVVGYIGGNQWMDWWTSQQVYGVVMFLCTSIVGFLYRAAHED